MADKWTQFSREYIASIRELATYICTTPVISDSNSSAFLHFADRLKHQAINALKSPSGNARISSEPNLSFRASNSKAIHPDPGHSIISIGGFLEFQSGELSEQSISLLIFFTPQEPNKEHTKTHLVRKIHFDFKRDNATLNKPTTHTQIGGNISHKMLPESLHYDDVEQEKFNQIDLPRIPSPPFGFASVIDLAVREFASQSVQNLTEETGWHKKVIKEEELLLGRYHKRIQQEYSNNSTRTSYALHCTESLCGIKRST